MTSALRRGSGAPKKHSQIIEALLLGQSKPEGVKVSEHFADVIEAGPQALSTAAQVTELSCRKERE